MVPGSFTILGVAAIVVALIVQAGLVSHHNVSPGQSVAVSLVAIVAGLVGAKFWYAILDPRPWRQALLGGWAVDGFLVVAPTVAFALLLVAGLPVGTFLDATAPGIFFAVALGRLGCFFTGCCAGRCTRSRWGVWSSDRRVGARRIPTQLLESGAGLLIAIVATVAALGHVGGIDGVVFIATLAAYVLVRQFLLRLREESRQYLWRRRATAASSPS